MPNDTTTAPKLRLMGLWKHKSRNGETYLAGNLGTARVLIFRNRLKVADDDPAPDFDVVLVPKHERKAPAERDSSSGG